MTPGGKGRLQVVPFCFGPGAIDRCLRPAFQVARRQGKFRRAWICQAYEQAAVVLASIFSPHQQAIKKKSASHNWLVRKDIFSSSNNIK
jgi:hypothetical protein